MKLIYTKSVLKDVRKIRDKKLITKVEVLIEDMKKASTLDELQAVKKMPGHPSAYRIRIGDYRLGIYSEDQTITLVRFVKRNDIYKLFP